MISDKRNLFPQIKSQKMSDKHNVIISKTFRDTN